MKCYGSFFSKYFDKKYEQTEEALEEPSFKNSIFVKKALFIIILIKHSDPAKTFLKIFAFIRVL